ncbi:MAG TPA: hypothetical protein VGC64_02465 [Pyrinomonadaceae bacterium]|jgi:hypothetical protein
MKRVRQFTLAFLLAASLTISARAGESQTPGIIVTPPPPPIEVADGEAQTPGSASSFIDPITGLMLDIAGNLLMLI